MSNKDIRKAFIKGEYSITINKVHISKDTKITVHDTLRPDDNREIYDFVMQAIKAYKASSEEKKEEQSQIFLKGYDKGYSEGYSAGSREAMSETIKAFAHMNGDYGEGKVK